jgi:NitT/TauT family transport system substrate-binding protein
MRPVRARARVSAVRIMIAAMSAVLLLSGCHVPGTTSASGNVAVSQTITVAMVPGIDNAPLLIAQRDGLFRKQGLDVVIKSYPTLSAVVAALSGGQAQIAAGDYTAFLYQEATGGQRLRLVADGYDAGQNMLEILTLPGSGITDPQQLVGKTVGTPEKTVSYPASTSSDNADLPYNIETLAAQTVLESDNVSPTAVNWTPIPPSAMIGELRSKKVSAILAPEPYVFEAEAQLGAQEVLDACSGVTAGLPLSGYFSKASYDNSAALARFRTALLQAQADSGMRGPLQAVLPSAAGISAQDAALVTLGTYPTSLSVGQVQRVAQLMFEAGMIGSTVSVRQLAAG